MRWGNGVRGGRLFTTITKAVPLLAELTSSCLDTIPRVLLEVNLARARAASAFPDMRKPWISGDPALPHPDCLSELSLAMAGPDGMTDVIGPQACLVQWKYSPSGC